MGILFETVMANKRKFLIEELRKMNVITSQNGTSLEDLDYEDLKQELVLASFRKIDAESSEGKWF